MSKDPSLGDALSGLGLEDADLHRRQPVERPQPVDRQPAVSTVKLERAVEKNGDGITKELRKIFIVLTVGLAIYVAQSLLMEWRYHQAQQALKQGIQNVEQSLSP